MDTNVGLMYIRRYGKNNDTKTSIIENWVQFFSKFLNHSNINIMLFCV